MAREGGNTWQLPGQTQEIRTENIRKQTFRHQTVWIQGRGERRCIKAKKKKFTNNKKKQNTFMAEEAASPVRSRDSFFSLIQRQ